MNRSSNTEVWVVFGAGDGIRTRDILLGKQTLCQLSYSRSGGGRILAPRLDRWQRGILRDGPVGTPPRLTLDHPGPILLVRGRIR